jgi:phospholipid/cholesterol/gamma-HCH transport system substrate-binding protein
MNDQRIRLRVGLFVLGAFILLGILATMFSNFSGILVHHDQYTIVFKDAPGIGPGTPVRRSGIRIGEVKSVTLDDETGHVRVVVLIEDHHPVRKNDQPTLVRGILGSDPSIDFIPRSANGAALDRSPIPPGTELAGSLGQDVRALLNQTSELVPSTQETLNDIRKSIQSFEKLAPQLSDAIKEYQELAKATHDLLPELKKTNEEILVTSRNWGKVGERMDVLLRTNEDKLVKTLDNFNETIVRFGNVLNDENQRNLSATLRQSQQTIERVQQAVAKTDEILANLQKTTRPMAERSDSIMKNLDESTAKLNQTLSESRELLHGYSQGDGTIRRFLNDPSLYNNLNDAAQVLVRLLPRLDRILHDLEVFADKVARHPESLGVRGAVSPNSGLKDAPSSTSHWPRN